MYVRAASKVLISDKISWDFDRNILTVDNQLFCFFHHVEFIPITLMGRLYIVCPSVYLDYHKTSIISFDAKKQRWRRRRIRMQYIGHSDKCIYLKKNGTVMAWLDINLERCWCLYKIRGVKWKLPTTEGGDIVCYKTGNPFPYNFEVEQFEMVDGRIHILKDGVWKYFDLSSGDPLGCTREHHQKFGDYLVVDRFHVYHKYDPNNIKYLPKPTLAKIYMTLLCLKRQAIVDKMYIPKSVLRFKIIPWLLDFY